MVPVIGKVRYNGAMKRLSRILVPTVAVLVMAGCSGRSKPETEAGTQVTTRGTVEVTARLVEVPEGAVFHRDLYDYATLLKYEVMAVHRGEVEKGSVIYVGHYNPWKPRDEAADRKVKDLGGNVRAFRAGALHRMALETPMDDFFMGGIVDKYFGKHSGPAFWAVWTDQGD